MSDKQTPPNPLADKNDSFFVAAPVVAAPEAVPVPAAALQRKTGMASFARSFVDTLRELPLRFPIALALLVVATVLGVGFAYEIFDEKESVARLLITAKQLTASDLAMSAMLACAGGAAAAVTAQLAAERHRPQEGATARLSQAAGIACAGAALIVYLLAMDLDRYTLFIMVMLAIAFCSLGLSTWLLMTDENEGTLTPWLIRSALFACFVGGVLQAGISVCIGAYVALLARIDLRAFLAAAVVVWMLAAPAIFLSQLPRADEKLELPRLWRTVMGYVVLPLSLVLLAILYIYIARIVLTRSFPSGEMNWYGSVALLVYLLLWLGLRETDHPLVRLTVRWGWLLLVPVVAVQLMGVWIRLSAYGITPLRAASLVCTGLGIFGLILAAINASPRPFFLVAAIAAAVSLASPANVVDVSNAMQERRLSTALVQAGVLTSDGSIDKEAAAALDEDQRRAIAGSWDYLAYADPVWFGIDSIAKQGRMEDILGIEEPAPVWEGSEFEGEPVHSNAYFRPTGERIAVEGWTSIEPAYLDVRIRDDGSVVAVREFFDVDFEQESTEHQGEELTVDLTELIGALEREYAENDDLSAYIEVPAQMLVLDLEDGSRLALSDIYLSYDDGKLSDVVVEAYLLRK